MTVAGDTTALNLVVVYVASDLLVVGAMTWQALALKIELEDANAAIIQVRV